MPAYYNELDPQKAAWLRELIKANVIAPGEVDERSITEIRPKDLRGFRQCHFFAGIGVWSYALRLAGWPDDRPVWTGSCPCPSFSAAGKGKGFADPRHLWPHWSSLIRECQPATVFGEQVASAIGHGWLDLVYVDLEAAAYSVGAAVLGACCVGAPHIRQRLYFVAHAMRSGTGHPARESLGAQAETDERDRGLSRERLRLGGESATGSGSDLQSLRRAGRTDNEDGGRRQFSSGRDGETGILSDSNGRIPSDRNLQRSGEQRLLAEDCGTGDGEYTVRSGLRCGRENSRSETRAESGLGRDGETLSGSDSEIGGQPMCGSAPGIARHPALTSATGGFWSDCDWWYGRDGKYRPIKSGLQPLAHGAANRVLKLRGYGDAIIPQVAQAFIEANMNL